MDFRNKQMKSPQPLSRVLILEDEPIIALDVEGILADAGFEVAGTLSTCAGAMEWLTTRRADVALLDIDLHDGSCEHVAQRLLDLGIPFVVFSGSEPTDETIDPVFLKGGWLEKPAPGPRIVVAVSEVLSSRRLPAPSTGPSRSRAS
jgi:DNA-binding NtrC family response regulator